jgi:hypothetical protein
MSEIGDGFASFWLPINPFVVVYVIGVLVGLLAIDARLPARLGLALLWPLGPIAFVVTISILLAASLVAFPVLGAIVLAGALVVALLTYVNG